MPRWFVDLWDEDNDAVRRLDDALRRPRIAPEAVGSPRTPEPDSGPVLTPLSRRERVSQLLARVTAGDVSARDALRRAIGGDDAA